MFWRMGANMAVRFDVETITAAIAGKTPDGWGEVRVNCPNPNCEGGQRDTLGVNVEDGKYHCFRCDLRGNFKANGTEKKSLAQFLYDQAQPVKTHPYPEKKQIQPREIRQDVHSNWVIPFTNSRGEIQTVQFIKPEGEKLFLSKAKNGGVGFKGAAYIIEGGKDTIIWCEGIATGWSIHHATGATVICCGSKDNLDPVMAWSVGRYPDSRKIVAGDNDKSGDGQRVGAAAARKYNVPFAVPGIPGTDFNDMAIDAGLDAVKKVLENAGKPDTDTGNQETPEPWEPIIPLDALAVDRINPATLPGAIGEFAEAVARETETPLELAAGMLFVVIAACVQGIIKIQVKPGYSEPLAFWTFAPMPPATRKSQVLKRITAPLTEWERRQRVDMEPLIEARRIDRENIQARIKALRGRYGKAERDQLPVIADEIKELSNSMEPELVAPQIWAQDTTPENAGQIMARNDERLTILAAEGGILDTLGGRYSAGVANLDLFLQGYSGDAVKVNRTTRDDIHLNTPALSMGLMPQPDVIRGMAAKPEFKGRGFIGRPLYMIPESNLGARTLDSEPIPDRIKISYYQTVKTLLEIQPVEHPDGTTAPHTLNLSPEAFQEWRDFYMTIEHDLADGGRFEHCRDWAGKTPGRAARLAGLLHCAINPVEPWRYPVSRETMEQALDITVVSISHALAVFNLMGADPAIESAGRVLQWIKRHRHQAFTKRQAFQDLKGSFNRAAMLDEPLSVLIERNHIRPMIETEKKPGRKSEAYEVNPVVLGGGGHGLA
jgi:putative DNA primase/helicase